MNNDAFRLTTLCFCLLAFRAVATTYYVDINGQNPTSPYSSWSTAATNIQNAIDASSPGDTIDVTDGVYQVGGETVPGYSLTNRVVINKPLTVQSVDGPGSTFIMGGAGIRCVFMTNNATLMGFTLANGTTIVVSPDANDTEGGGVWCASTNSDIVSNCVIAANIGYGQGGGAYQGTLLDCTVLGNKAQNGGGVANAVVYRSLIISNAAISVSSSVASGGGAYNSSVFSSAIVENSANYQGGGAFGGSAVNCTIIGNSSHDRGGGIGTCAATNCIIYYNNTPVGGLYIDWNLLGTTPRNCCIVPNIPPGIGNITNDPAMADIAHISLNSPCRGAGNPAVATGTDIDGNPWNNPPSIGCSEIPSGGDYGNLSVNISTPFTNWAPGYPANFQATISGPVYTTVWNFGDGTILTNGPFLSHVWSSAGIYPVTLTEYNDGYPTGVTATLMMNIAVPTNNYVNSANRNPVPPYSYWSIAATNIQDAVNVAAPGSTVLVTNPAVLVEVIDQQFATNYVAVYEFGGTNAPDGNFYRVVITNAITVQSVNGPGVTWIEGSFPNNGANMGCVYMTNGAVLNGFTLTNASFVPALYATSTNAFVTNCVITHAYDVGGASSGTFNNCVFTGNSDPYGYGGAAASSVLNNCLVTNNSAEYGGGICGGIVNNCIIVSNTASYGGGAFGGTLPLGEGTYPLFLNNCLISNNIAGDGAGVSGYVPGYGLWPVFTNCVLSNCVITANSTTGSAAYGGGAMDAVLNNCIVSSNNSSYGGGMAGGFATNCSFIGNGASVYGGGASSDSYNFTLPEFTVLNNCTLVGNNAPGGGGAALGTLNNCTLLQNVGSGFESTGGGAYSCIVNECQILTNSAYYGGGADGGTLTNCLLAGNTANYGGGVDGGFGNNSNPNGTILNNCTLTANVATNAGGGAIQCTLSYCTLTNNLSDFAGAGAAHALLSGCIINSNFALALVPDSRDPVSGGGGVYDCAVTNCVVAFNFATTNGGGAFGSTLVNCTVIANIAVNGGGAFDSTNDNCIVYQNTGGDFYPNTSQYPLNYCCVSSPVTYGIRAITNRPVFVSPGNFHLQSSSPCINSGNNAYVTLPTDLDANSRIAGGTVDIGAFEYQTPTSVISYAYLQKYGLPTDGSVDFKILDGTTFDVYQDWIAGLNPTNSSSVLAMLGPITTNTATGVTVTWQSVSGIPYFLQRSTNLTSQPPFSTIQNNITGQSNTTSYVDSSATNSVPYFYRVGVVAP